MMEYLTDSQRDALREEIIQMVQRAKEDFAHLLLGSTLAERDQLLAYYAKLRDERYAHTDATPTALPGTTD